MGKLIGSLAASFTGAIAALVLQSAAWASADNSRTDVVAPQDMGRARLVVLSDFGADPDDTQSLVRLLLYSNDIDIQAIVATTSAFQKARTRPELALKVVEAFGKVRSNLEAHEPGFPTPSKLRAIVSEGVPRYGMTGVGEGNDSPGSDKIVALLSNSDPRPLWVSVWGGPNTLAQALWKIRKTLPAAQAARMYAKLRVYAISDQDDSGFWIRANFPGVFYIVSPGLSPDPTWTGMTKAEEGSDQEIVSDNWIAKNIQQGHGPLGAAYPDVSYGMEGDSPSFLGLIRNGLNDMEHPNWGGWGGRYELATPGAPKLYPGLDVDPPTRSGETRPIWTDAMDVFGPPRFAFAHVVQCPAPPRAPPSKFATIWRWRRDLQNDFAARMLWTTKPPSEANHRPVAILSSPAYLTVRSGELFDLDATKSYDPDGDSLSFLWFQYPEAGTYTGQFCLPGAENLSSLRGIKAPDVATPQTIHIVLQVTDKGSPPLTTYRRVVVRVTSSKSKK